jgi:ubiquitin C-terminal hydrolase
LKKNSENESLIDQIFQGNLLNLTKCLNCNDERITKENFLDLSIPVLDRNHRKLESLNECLENFFKEELMEQNNQIYCEKCKIKSDGIKKTMLNQSPNVLVLQLSRFTYDLKKLNHPIQFPSSEFDLSIYSKDFQNNDPYELNGIVYHFGNLHGGHYVASCKNEHGDWILYDDSNVKSIQEIQSSCAYLLFYVRKKR